MPMKQLSWKTPFEVLHGTPPSYEALKTIGCLCYVVSLGPNKDKFDPKGIICVLIGYPPGQKGYKLYNVSTHELIHSRDVIFQKSVFPFKEPVITFAPSIVKPVCYPDLSTDEEVDVHEAPNTNPLPDQTTELIHTHEDNAEPLPNTNQPSNSSQNIPTRRSARSTTAPKWLKDFIAMEKDLAALEQNKTWELTNLPIGHKPITSKWVYKIKYKADRLVERLKARLVVKRFNQKEGLDYKHTLSHVAKFAIVRVIIALATAKGWPLHQLDSTSEHFTVVLIYVDDVLVSGDSINEITQVNEALDQKFTSKDMGEAKYFLEIKVCRTNTACKPNPSPLPTSLHLSLDKGTPITDVGVYRRLVCRLLYFTITRPGISYVVQHLNQFVSAPKDTHMQAPLYLLKYLKGTISKGLFYPVQSQLEVTGFSDADSANCLMTRRSLTGYCIFLGHLLSIMKNKEATNCV
ncbi:integrase [Tanacetum coccineum]